MSVLAKVDTIRDGFVYRHVQVFGVPASPAIWLKADALTGLADDDPVTTWTDQSGNARNFTAAGAARPLYKTNIINGKPALRFDATDDEMGAGNLSSVFPTAATMFVVFKLDGAHAYSLFEDGNRDIHWNFSGTGYYGTFRTSRVESYPTGIPNGAGSNYITIVSSSARYKAYVNGTAKADQTAAYTCGTVSRLGRGQNSTGRCDIAEVIFYDRELTTTEIAQGHTYITTKYAL